MKLDQGVVNVMPRSSSAARQNQSGLSTESRCRAVKRVVAPALHGRGEAAARKLALRRQPDGACRIAENRPAIASPQPLAALLQRGMQGDDLFRGLHMGVVDVHAFVVDGGQALLDRHLEGIDHALIEGDVRCRRREDLVGDGDMDGMDRRPCRGSRAACSGARRPRLRRCP